MKKLIPSIVLGLALFFVGALCYRFLAHAWMTHELIVDSKSYHINESTVDFKGGHAFQFPHSITNLSTDNPDGTLEQVSQHISAAGTINYYAQRTFAKPKQLRLFERSVKNIFNEEVLHNHVYIDISRYPDDGYLYSVYPSGGGHAGYSVRGSIISHHHQGFVLKVQENIFGDMFDYELDVNTQDEKITLHGDNI